MSVSGFSQAGYPRLIVLPEGDTVVAITKGQMDALLLTKVAVEEKSDSLREMNLYVEDLKVQVRQRDTSIVELTRQRDIANTRATSSAEMVTKLETSLKKAERKIKWLKLQKGIIGVVAIAEAAVLAFILISK